MDAQQYCWSSRRTVCTSQHPHGDSQPFLTPIPGNQSPLLASAGSRHTRGTKAYMQAKHPYKLNKII